MKKVCVRLSISTSTSIEYLMKLNIVELSDIAAEVEDVMKE